jgi:hypothetical protein
MIVSSGTSNWLFIVVEVNIPRSGYLYTSLLPAEAHSKEVENIISAVEEESSVPITPGMNP